MPRRFTCPGLGRNPNGNRHFALRASEFASDGQGCGLSLAQPLSWGLDAARALAASGVFPRALSVKG
eukprot:6271836-Alexandrium_andersonii.AAC.1